MERHRLILAGVVVLFLVFAVAFSKPSVTGYVPTETVSQGIDVFADASQRFYVRSDRPVALSGLSLSGVVEGDGLFNAYLVRGGERVLVASNERSRRSAMAEITGMMSVSVQPGERLDVIESTDYVVSDKSFVNECVDSCILDPKRWFGQEFVLDVVLEPGTAVRISRIRFSVAEE